MTPVERRKKMNEIWLTTSSYAAIHHRLPRYTSQSHMKILGIAAWQLDLIDYGVEDRGMGS